MSSSSYPQKQRGLDTRVWLAMLLVSVLSIGLISYNKATEEPCAPLNIAINSSHKAAAGRFNTNEVITFSSLRMGKKSENIVWSFGDATPTAKGSRVTHNYAAGGNYTVTATINGKCGETKVISVKEIAPIKTDSVILTNDIITGNFSPNMREKATYKCIAFAKSYEWRILYKKSFDVQTGQEAIYSFPNVNTYTLQLRLDNNPHKTFSKTIHVLPSNIGRTPRPIPLPPLPAPPRPPKADTSKNPVAVTPSAPTPDQPKADAAKSEPPRVIEVNDRRFLKLLQGVIAGSNDVQDFNDYLQDKGKTRVFLNNKDWKTLEELCLMIKGNRERKAEAVEAVRVDKQVTHLKVKAKKKNWLGRWVDL